MKQEQFEIGRFLYETFLRVGIRLCGKGTKKKEK